MVIKRIVPLSFAKIAGTLYAIMGLVFGCIVSVIALAGGFASASQTSQFANLGAMVGVGAIIILPIFYGGLGFVIMLVAAALYNVVAGLVGGIELDVQ
jgi:hypothetical protein